MATKRKVVSDVARSAHSNGRDATRPSEIAQLRYELERLRGELQFTQAQRDEYRQKMNLLLDRLVPPLPPWTATPGGLSTTRREESSWTMGRPNGFAGAF